MQRMPSGTLPETGTMGRAHGPSLLSVTFDPDNTNFEPSLADGDVRRTVAHEVHHCLRMAGPGYGETLGEALVSEGLAGQFAGRLFDALPEPWERACSDDVLAAHFPDGEMLANPDYDHRAWFFGHGGRYPRWLGYTLGYRIVGDWLATAPKIDGDEWIKVEAHKVLAAGMHRLSTAIDIQSV